MSRRDAVDEGQPSTRRPGTLTDQHGRKWFAQIDKRSGFPVGVVQPQGWRAPWMPPQGYFRFSPDDPTRMTIDYERMLSERLADHEQWLHDFKSFALARGWDPDDEAKAMNIIERVGQKPKPVEPLVACIQGNKWILGLTNKVDERLVPFIQQAKPPVQRAIQGMDFSTPPESLADDLEELMDIQEDADPDATPRGRVPVKPRGRPKKAVPEAA